MHGIKAGYPAGLVLPSVVKDDVNDVELRVAFDFDGVLADDESERIFQEGNLDAAIYLKSAALKVHRLVFNVSGYKYSGPLTLDRI